MEKIVDPNKIGTFKEEFDRYLDREVSRELVSPIINTDSFLIFVLLICVIFKNYAWTDWLYVPSAILYFVMEYLIYRHKNKNNISVTVTRKFKQQ